MCVLYARLGIILYYTILYYTIIIIRLLQSHLDSNVVKR